MRRKLFGHLNKSEVSTAQLKMPPTSLDKLKIEAQTHYQYATKFNIVDQRLQMYSTV